MPRRRPCRRSHRAARFLLIQTVALWLCLMAIVLTCSGYTQGERVAMRALAQLGKPYALGAVGPERFDCSGLVMYCLAPEGFEFPLHAAEIIGTDAHYPLIESPRGLLVGDVVCFDTVQDRDPSDHMGFYIGGNQFVHASSTGEVKVSALEGYYLEQFTGARRYVRAYCDLPNGAQIAAWLRGADLPARLAPAREWLQGLEIPLRLENAKGTLVSLWNSIFGRS